MSWVAVAVAAVGTVSAVYSADQSRKGIHAQQDALNAAQADDARKAAEAETSAQVAANAQTADAKRRRRASALGTGDTSQTTLGGGTSVLAGGAGQAPAAANAGYYGSAAASYGGTALGAGAPASSGVMTRGGGSSGPVKSRTVAL